MDFNDFQKKALRTKSPQFNNLNSDCSKLLSTLQDFSDSAEHLNTLRKALFAAKGELYHADHQLPKNQTIGNMSQENIDILHGLLGLIAETKEILDAFKPTLEAAMRHDSNPPEVDFLNLSEEAGDVLWSTSLIAKTTSFDFNSIAKGLINKLELRHPQGFTSETSVKKDHEAEIKVISGALINKE